MNMAGGILLLLCAAAIIAIAVYRNYKANGKCMSFDKFMDTYGDNITNVLSDVVEVLRLKGSEFSSYEEYEHAVITMTIEKIKENAAELGIDQNVLNLFDTVGLTIIVKRIINSRFKQITMTDGTQFMRIEPVEDSTENK